MCQLTQFLAAGASMTTEQREELDFVKSMVCKYRELLIKGAGMQSISVDGQTVSLTDLESKYQVWENKLAVLKGRKPRLSAIKMGGV